MFIDDRSVQRALSTGGFYAGTIDGAFGAKSTAAARAYAMRYAPSYETNWTDARVRIAVEQCMMASIGAYNSAIDGLAGPATQVAVEKWQDHTTFETPTPGHIVSSSPFQRDVERFYGKPGEHQVKLASPYPLYLDWDLNTKTSGFQCHEKIHDAAERVMKRVLAHYGPEKIHTLGLDQFGGCLNVRKMRNGQAMSMHSWGIALDWDADRNPLRATSKTALMATAPYAPFLDLWEEEGFVSLGRARNFDWMHVQAARL